MRWWRHWQEGLSSYVERNAAVVMLLSSLFVVGVVFGALAVGGLPGVEKLQLASEVLDAARARESGSGQGFGPITFSQSFATQLRMLALFWVLGISVVGSLGVIVIAFLRGFLTGFVVGFLAAEMGWRGVLLAVAGHLPQSLLQVPALLLAGTASIGFSRLVLRAWRERRRMYHFYQTLWQYTTVFILAALAMAGASLLESKLAPSLIALVTRL